MPDTRGQPAMDIMRGPLPLPSLSPGSHSHEFSSPQLILILLHLRFVSTTVVACKTKKKAPFKIPHV